MIPNAILRELYEIFDRPKSDLKSKRNIDLKVTVMNEPSINAMATLSDEIIINTGLLYKLFNSIYRDTTFDKPIQKIVEKCNIKDDFAYIKKSIYIVTISICYFHELGHIVNGHLKYIHRDKHCFETLSEALDETGLSSTITKYKDRSLFEHDADTYAGISITGLVFNNFGIKCPKDKKKLLEKYAVLVSSFILFFTLRQISHGQESDIYPPYIWRFYSMAWSFLESHSSMQEEDGLPTKDIAIEIDDDFIRKNYDNDTKELFSDIYSAVGFAFSDIENIFNSPNMATWYEFYRKNLSKISECHDFAAQ